MAGVLEDFNKTPAELELELSKAKGRVARLEALLGNRAEVAESREIDAELGASFSETVAKHNAELDVTSPEDYWKKKLGTSIPQPDGYSGCGLEKPSWAKPVVTSTASEAKPGDKLFDAIEAAMTKAMASVLQDEFRRVMENVRLRTKG
jgi:hypothetical protein